MIYDSHIHLCYGPCDTPKEFLEKAAACGVTHGNIFAPAAKQHLGRADGDYRWEARLDYVLAFTAETPNFLPFFRFDATAPDVEKQVRIAAERGCRGFKIICEGYHPWDTLRACEAVAETGLPLMFHCGVLSGMRDQLWGHLSKPMDFECLFGVKGLRFSLAHLGWPWVDEYLGVVAKAYFTHDPEFGNEMFADLTPGTPGYYREPSLERLYLTGYNIKHNILWGTDLTANNYEIKIAKFLLKRDREYMARIQEKREVAQLPFMDAPPDLSDIFELCTCDNALRFVARG